MKQFVIIDRDGTIIEEMNYLKDPNKIKFIDGAINSLKALYINNINWMIASNQAGIAKGIISTAEFESVSTKFEQLLLSEGIHNPIIKYCPHHKDGIIKPYNINCSCRKPEIGMVKDVLKNKINEYKISVIGDKISDIKLAQNLNAKAYLVRTGYGKETELKINELSFKSIFIVDDINEAVNHIIDGIA